MKSVIEQIREEYPIHVMVVPYTGGLRASGGSGEWFIGRCPFCQKETAPKHERKFWVNKKTGICGCFRASCKAAQPGGRPMDVINFWARLHGLSNREAIDDLRARTRVYTHTRARA